MLALDRRTSPLSYGPALEAGLPLDLASSRAARARAAPLQRDRDRRRARSAPRRGAYFRPAAPLVVPRVGHSVERLAPSRTSVDNSGPREHAPERRYPRMSRDRRGDRTQEVIGSIPFSSTKSNDLRSNDLAVPSSSTKSGISAQVSNRASNLRRDDIVSRRLERDDSRDGVPCIRTAAWT